MKVLCIDIETYSSINLLKSGVYKYVSASDFKILMLAYSWWGDDEVHLLDLTKQKIPKWLRKALVDPTITKTAYNAAFEIACLARELDIDLPFEQWDCTMVRGGRSGYTMNLGATAVAMRIDEQKDAAGNRLIKLFSVPCAPTKKNGYRTRNLPEHDPEKWQQFCDYCKQDVRTEKAIREYVLKVPVTDFEQKLWCLDQKINNTGIRLDKKMVKAAIGIYETFVANLKSEAQFLTGLDNPNSRNQLVQWLIENGEEVEDLKKATVKTLMKKLAQNDETAIMRVLEIRQQMAKTSVKKYYSMLEYLAEDGRIHNLLQFYGANRTGRWAGRGVQLHNLPQNHLKVDEENDIDDLSLARSVVRKGQADLFEFMYGNVPDTLSQLIRTAFIAGKGKRFCIADFSAIEAVVIAWLSGEKWRLDVFNTHGKIYEASAAKMFKVPLESISYKDKETGNTVKGINYDLRAKGKISELACIAEGQLVLTDQGLVPIENVTSKHKVWDGLHWVTQEGAIFKGVKNVIEYEGLKATKDHLVWVEGEREPVHFGIAASCGKRLLESRPNRKSVWSREDINRRTSVFKTKVARRLRTRSMPELRKNSMGVVGQSFQRSNQRLPIVFTTSANTTVVRSKVDSSKTTLRKPIGQRVSVVWSQRNRVQVQKCAGSGVVFAGKIRFSGQEFGSGSRRQQWALRTGKPSISSPSCKPIKQTNFKGTILGSKQVALRPFRSYPDARKRIESGTNIRNSQTSSVGKKEKLAVDCGEIRVYDLVNCGPLNRFTVSGVLVHNCGYQGAKGALITMGGLTMGLTEEEMPDIIKTWRRENKKIVEFWYDCQRCAINAILNPKKTYEGKKGILFFMKRRNLYIKLPSGRLLCYVGAKVCRNKWDKPGIAYWGMDQRTKKWGKQETYGGKLVENIVQAFARDCLAVALMRVDEAGYKIVLHVHDEIVVELGYEEKGSLKHILRLMTKEIPWAPGLPLRAAGFESKYYKKD